MKRRFLMMLTALMPGSVVAQDNVSTLPQKQVRAMVTKYANCMVRLAAPKVSAALHSYMKGEKPNWPVINDCAINMAYQGTEISFPQEAYAFAMADALYLSRFGKAPIVSFDAVPPVAPPQIEPPVGMLTGKKEDMDRSAYDKAIAQRYLMIIGDCIVRTDPMQAHQLLISGVDTSAEKTAIASLTSVFAQCLPEKQTAKVNRPTLRGIIALNAYWLNHKASQIQLEEGKPGTQD